MELYNYVAGGSFPPRMPKRFDERLFGRSDVVIFALAISDDSYYGHNLAGRLQTSSKFRGLVYSFSPENRDYLKCADFFKVSAFPSFVVVPYKAFRKFLCTDSYGFDRFDDYYYKHLRYSSTYPHYSIEDEEEVQYAIINGDALEKDSSKDSQEEVLKLANLFCIEGINKTDETIMFSGSISKNRLDTLVNSAHPLQHNTEIKVLFTRPAWRHTEFERILYEAFIRFGSITDDVLVRILYPTHISDEYAKYLAEYNIIRLPAAIFTQSRSGRLVVKAERDFFESIQNLDNRISFIISDTHRAIAAGKTTTARKIVKELQSIRSSQPIAVEESKTETGKIIANLRPENLIIVQNMNGNIVAGDKIQG